MEGKNMDYNKLLAIKDMLNKHKDIFEKLDTYRNKWLAHDDIKKPELPPISGEEIKVLFDVLAKILNTITGRLNSESWGYSQVEGDVKFIVGQRQGGIKTLLGLIQNLARDNQF